MTDEHQFGLSTPANGSEQEPAGGSVFSHARLSSVAPMSGSDPGSGDGVSRNAALGFIDTLLGIAPKSVLELSGEIMSLVSKSRALMHTDTAAAVGCILVYYMEREDAASFLETLDDPSMASFLVALALRTQADVNRADVLDCQDLLPSGAARLTPSGDRKRGAAHDLEMAKRGILNGEIATDDVFNSATVAMTTAATRFASKAGSDAYSPLLPFSTSVPATRSSPLSNGLEEGPAVAASAP